MSFIKKFVTVASTVALVAGGLMAPLAAHAAAHGAGSVVKTPDGTVWFITNDNHRRAFTSAGAFLSYGFLSFSQVVDANSDDTALVAGSFIPPRDGAIFCATATKGSDVAGECALITGGMKAAFTSAAVFAGQGHSFSRAQYGDSSFLSKTSNIDNAGAAHRQGVLVNFSGTVYLVGSSTLLGIPSVDVFNSWGYSFADVVTANAADNSMTKSGVMCARTAGDLNPSFTGTCSTVVNPGPGGLNGSAGSIDTITTTGSPNNEQVAEGDSNHKVFGVEIKADNGSDLRLTSMKLDLRQLDAGGSRTMDKYMTSVSVYDGSTKVGSSDVADFTKTTNTYSHSVSLDSSSVIPMGQKVKFYVAVSAVDTIDSTNLNNNDWIVGIDSIRYNDATGAILTQDGGCTDVNNDSIACDNSRHFSFGSLTTVNDVVMKVSLADSSPSSAVIKDSTTNGTDGVDLLTFKIKAQGSDMHIDAIPIDLTTSATNVTDVANTLNLKVSNGDDFSQDVAAHTNDDPLSNDCNGANTCSVIFDSLNLDVPANDTWTFTVSADVNKQDDFTAGDTLKADLTAGTGDVNNIDVTDSNDDQLDTAANGARSGSALGEEMAFYDKGIMVDSAGTTTSVTSGSGPNDDIGTFTVKFKVTAFGDTMYIPNTVDTSGYNVQYQIDASASGVASGDSGTITCVDTCANVDAPSGNAFQISDGQTRTFTMTVTTGDSTQGQFRVDLVGVPFDLDDDGNVSETGEGTYDFNLDNSGFRTAYIGLN